MRYIFFLFFLAVGLQPLEVKSQSLGTSSVSNISDNTFTTGLYRNGHMDFHKPSGKVVFVWTDTLTSTSNKEIFCAIYASDMTLLVSPFRINKNTSSDQFYPQVKVNQTDNSFAVTWSSKHSGNHDIYAKKIFFDANFTNVKYASELLINNVQTGDQITPILTFDYFRNELLVAWRDGNPTDGNGIGAFFRRISYNSDSLTSSDYKELQYQINQYTTGHQLPRCIEVSPITGELMTLCQAVTAAGTGYEVVRRIFTYNSITDSYSGDTELSLNTYTTNDQIATSLVFNHNNGDYCVAWTSTSGDGSAWAAYSKFYNKSHTVVKDEFLISNTTLNYQHTPRAVWDADNNIVIYFYVNGGGSSSTIKYRMFNSSGSYTAIANESDALEGAENTQNIYNTMLFPVFNPINKKVYLDYEAFNNFTGDSKVKARMYQYSHPSNVTINNSPSYAELKEELDASYYTTIKDTLYFRYNEKYNQGASGTSLNYKIYDYKRSVLASSSLTKKFGANFYKINLNGVASLSLANETYYILEVINDKGEVKMLRFRYIPEY